MKLPIYMDYHASTPVDPRVLEAMLPYFGDRFGNASSRNHPFGEEASEAVERARAQAAALLGAATEEILFTSGGTESDNLAIKGAARALRSRGDHLVTAATEHKAVLESCRRLEEEGFRVTVLPVDSKGTVSPGAVLEAVTERTILLSIMAANNEVGTLQPLQEIGRIAKEKGVLFHSDATQGVGKIPISVRELDVDLLSFSAHKIYGPKGVGALFVRRRSPKVRLSPLFDGGGQERGIRSGTLNVPGIVGLGLACELCRLEMAEEARRLRSLRDRLHRSITSRIEGTILNGHPERRLPGNLNLSFRNVDGEALLSGLRDIALSSGSACISATREPSYVLKALGLPDELANSSIRFGLGRWTTEEEVDFTANRVVEEVTRLRSCSPLENDEKRLKAIP